MLQFWSNRGHHMNYVIINQSLSLGDSEIRAPIWWAAPWTDHTAKISIWWNNPNPLLLVVCCKAVTATEHIQNLEEKQTNKQTKTKKKKSRWIKAHHLVIQTTNLMGRFMDRSYCKNLNDGTILALQLIVCCKAVAASKHIQNFFFII